MSRNDLTRLLRNIAAPMCAGLVVAAYCIAVQWNPPRREVITHHRSRVRDLFRRRDAPQVIYFGSSAALENTRSATDHRNLAQLLAQHLNLDEARVLQVAFRGLHPRVFEAVFESITTQRYQPRLLVVPIEMRAFAVTWWRNPRLQHDRLIAALGRSKISPTDRVLKALRLEPYRRVAEAVTFAPHRIRPLVGPPVPIYGKAPMEFADYIQMLVDLSIEEGSDEWQNKLETQFRAHYLGDIHATHPFLAALERLGKRAREAGVAVVYYIAPVNVEDLERYTGSDATRLKQNIHLVKQTLQRAGELHVIDLSTSLGSDRFTDKRWTCEHLDIRGRSQTARHVADYVRAHHLLSPDLH